MFSKSGRTSACQCLIFCDNAMNGNDSFGLSRLAALEGLPVPKEILIGKDNKASLSHDNCAMPERVVPEPSESADTQNVPEKWMNPLETVWLEYQSERSIPESVELVRKIAPLTVHMNSTVEHRRLHIIPCARSWNTPGSSLYSG
jgi:hypothetical protein